MKPIVILDFDGVVIDTISGLYNCLDKFLFRYNQRANKKMFNLLRGQTRGRDKGQENGLIQKTTPIKLIHFPNNLENRVFPKK